MASRLIEIFEDEKIVEKVKKRLPYLFQLAELESSRGGCKIIWRACIH